MSLSRSFSSFFSRRHRDVVSMEVSLDDWCPNQNFYLGKATSWSAYDGLGFIPVEEGSWEEESEEEVMEEEEEMAADPRPSKKKVMGTVGDRAEASDRTHITESKQLWVAQNDLREPQMKLEAKSSSLQHWLQLTYELELHNYNAKKTIAEQQLQAAEEGCEKLSNRAGNFMDAFTGGGSTDDVDSKILKAKAVLFNLTTDLQEITYRWKQIEMLCGFPILLNPGFARLESTLHPNLINGAMRNTHSDVAKTRDNDDERKSNSSSLKDDTLGDLCTSEIKLEIENSAEVVDVSKTSLTGPSSPTEKEQKQMKTDSSPRSPESDEIIIIPPTQKPQHSEIITCNDDEVIPFGDQATVSRLELNHGVSSNKSTIILPLLTSFSKSSPSFICKTSDVPNSSTVPPVSTVVCPREAHLPPKLSSFKTDNEDLQIVTVKDDSVERNETPPALSPCPQISHTNFTIPNGYTVGDIKCTDLRENRLINYDENLDDVSEYVSEYEEHGKTPKRSLDEPISEKKKNVGNKKAKGDLDEPRSEYEKEIEERRAKNLEFLKSIALDEAKNDFIDAVNSTKKKRRKSVEKSEIPAIKRTSKRQKELIYYKIDMSRWMLEQRLLSTESTFRKALKSDKFYEDFVKDFNGITEEDCIVQTPVLYNKDILKQLSQKTCLRINKIYSPSALSWYPSAENLVLAVGGSSGNFGLWNIKESNSEPHIFSIHSKKVSHLQFNPCNPFQLISSSLDGTLVCCDMQKQISSKVLKISDVGCSYFDRYSPSSYLLSLTNGQVVIADKRTEYGQESYLQTRYSCHNSSINTINVHPLAKNYFVTAGSDRKVCIWDLRNLTHSAIVQTTYADSVYSAFFSPVSGKFLLTTSRDKIMRIFDCENMTEGRLKLHKTKEYESFLCNAFVNDPCKNRLLWLPNSDETFACSQRNPLTVLQIYDKDFNVHETIPDGTPGCKYLNMFHPFKAAFTSVSQAGYIKVFA